MSSYSRRDYARNRDEHLAQILAFLRNDERFVAAWLTGSIGRNEGDELSDFDLRVVVADAYAEQLCACSPQQVGTVTSAERLALYKQFGQPLVLCEAPGFPPTGGCFNHVVYRETAITVDWVLIPQKDAHIPQQECRLLLDKVGLPSALPVSESTQERLRLASRDVSAFWMMTSISIKYVLRGDLIMGDRFIFGNAYLLQDVKQRVAGETLHWQRMNMPFATTRAEQVTLIRQLCAEMQEEMRKLVAQGGQVPDDPMSIIEVWLSIE
ncbi:hypothetical protein KSC_018110 [Ktedonobacter sp. SOSP1-52]|uniref:hypothetical protein n=1 Tax=Ktedonobacter sp. SOSP1-52 TaxID=2778366 RepID=UPI0019155343|nr:hypothetical protein [Ktedonobacter sp. SOSP1-52]GHO62919.1 hypothetical protein KSC_018110 [Ktedonobacter sp. SOSP1-52]